MSMRRKNPNFSLFFVSLILFLCLFRLNSYHAENMNSEQEHLSVPVGVVLDLNSPFGSMLNLCFGMAVSDFYSTHSDYKTRLQLHKKDAKTLLDVNFAVLELVKKEEVLAILGPQGSVEETYAVAVGEASLVPIISYTARSSALGYEENQYFIRTMLDDAVQAWALADICERFKWAEVVVLYEENDDGNHFLSNLIKKFQESDIGLTYMLSLHASAEDDHILKELNKARVKLTRVFLVHMNPALGSRLFALANIAGMMTEGYAWIITDSLSIFLNSIDADTRDSMDGVLGIRPYPFPSKNLDSFQEMWKRNMLSNKNADRTMELNIYGLWVYDAVTALATAVENIKPVDSSTLPSKGTDKTGLRISSFGPKLISELSNTKFRGLAGDFQLVEGKLKPSALEIFNVIGNGERRVGFWTPGRGIIREWSESSEQIYSDSSKELKKVVWPGDSLTQPKGRTFPATGILRVGVPWKAGYQEFVNVKIDPATNKTDATGFVIDIFNEALKALPNFSINHTFICNNDSTNPNWSYDSMLHKIPKDYDMVIGDVTIWAYRASLVDFSLPYTESGIVLVIRSRKGFDMWTFVRPLRWDLWLAIFVSCLLIGVVLYILERGRERNGDDPVMPRQPPVAVYWSPIAVLAFQDRDMVSNKWSVFVLVCWLFMAYILMQSYTANLSAILTLDQLSAFSNDYLVGYRGSSFMKTFLMKQLNINESRLTLYQTLQELHDAMTRGSKNGGIDAIYDEIPYVKLFISRYGSQYKIVGPTYGVTGFGFAFPIGSPLVACFSRAILNVTQGQAMKDIERRNFGPEYSSQDPLPSDISHGTSGSSLSLHEFAGLFLATGSLILFALFFSETAIGQKLTVITECFVQNCFDSRNSRVQSIQGHVSAPDNVNTPPTAQPMGDDDKKEAEEIVETGLENDASAAQDAGLGTENQG